MRAILGTEPKVSRIRKGMTLVKCTIFDESGSLGVTWFNQPYITAQLRVGQEYLFYGRVQGFGRARQMISPQAEKVAENDRNPGRIVPVYPLTAGLTQRDMARVTEAALDAVPGDWPDPLPEVLRVKYRLPDAADSARRHPSPENQGRRERSAPPHGIEIELFRSAAAFSSSRSAAAQTAAFCSAGTVWRNFSQLCRSLRRAHSAAPSWKLRRTAPQAVR